jgi:mycoredoxin
MSALWLNYSECRGFGHERRKPRLSGGLSKKLMNLTVYSAAWCPDCREAKRFLAKHNIPYKDIDIENTPGAVEEIVKHTGKRAIPQFVIDGEWVQPYATGKGFRYDEMAKRLGISNP